MNNRNERHSGEREYPDTGRKRHKRKKKSRFTGFQKFLIAVLVVLAVILVANAVENGLFVRPDLDGIMQDEEDWGDGTRPKTDGKRKSEDFYTVLVVGLDTGGGGNTDTMMLASYDVTNQKASVMSLPRDTMVNVPWDVKKLNSVYGYNDKGEEGIQALYKEIAQLVGFEPDFRVVVEWDSVGAIVDAIGGVWFDNPYPMDFHDPQQDLVIEQAPGYRLFKGKDAMQVIRWRGNDPDSPYGYQKNRGSGGIGDVGRMKLQQDFLKATIDQLLKPENILKINKIVKVFRENVDTDLSFQNILWLGKSAISGGLNSEKVDFFTMPFEGASAWSRTYHTSLSYVVPVADELLELVNTKLSPFEEPFELDDLDIMSVNRDGSLHSTTGHLEDPKAAGAPVMTGKPSKPVDLPEDFQPIPEEPSRPEKPHHSQPAEPEQPHVPTPEPEPPAPEVPDTPPEPVNPPEPDVPPTPPTPPTPPAPPEPDVPPVDPVPNAPEAAVIYEESL